jgi:hypothetical protein
MIYRLNYLKNLNHMLLLCVHIQYSEIFFEKIKAKIMEAMKLRVVIIKNNVLKAQRGRV